MNDSTLEPDTRTPEQIASDERIASEPHEPIPDIPAGTKLYPFEYFEPKRRPTATMGIVENGIIRPLDPNVHLTEQSRVIIVTSEAV